MSSQRDRKVRMIPVEEIEVVNPRDRIHRDFQELAANIGRVGLKKPITVALRCPAESDKPAYLLVCGQGRLEAFRLLGQPEIPALVAHVSKQELLVMSLVENVARRTPTCQDRVREIQGLRGRGYTLAEIAKKVDVPVGDVRGLLLLAKQGEERLLKVVQEGRLPIHAAVTIATKKDRDAKQALNKALEAGRLDQRTWQRACRLMKQRRAEGKRVVRQPKKAREAGAQQAEQRLVATYREQTARQASFVEKARRSEAELDRLVSGLRTLLGDTRLVTLLGEEQLPMLPVSLVDAIAMQEANR